MNDNGEARVKELVFTLVKQAQALYEHARRTEGPCRFEWLGEGLWSDRRRLFVADHESLVELGFGDAETLTPDGVEELSHRDARCSIRSGSNLVRSLAYLVARGTNGPSSLAELVNLAVVQPSVNPAFEPLLWVALAWQMRLSEDRSQEPIEAWLGPMAFDMMLYPESRAEAAAVRAAQRRFVENVAGAPSTAPDDEWPAACWRLFESQQPLIDSLFRKIAFVARADFGWKG